MKQKSPAHAQALWSRRRTLLAFLGVALFSSLLYTPSLRNGFVSDDVILIGTPDIRTLDAAALKRIFTTHFWDASDATSGMYRPLTTLSFYTDYRLYGPHAAGFHLTNIILNAATAAMVFLVWLEIFSQPWLALVAALWFAAFPMHVENVAWISGRTDLFATLFALVSLWFYVRWSRRGSAVDAAASLVMYALALLGKEVAVVLPGVVAAYELLPRGEGSHARRGRGRWIVLIGMVALTAGYFGLRRQFVVGASLFVPRITHGIAGAAALTFATIAHYAYKLVYPFRLNPDAEFRPPVHFFNVHTLVGIAVIALTIWSVIRWRRNRAFLLGVAVIACGLSPVLQIAPTNLILAERFLYFPSIGAALLVALAVMHFFERRRVATMATCFAVVVAFCATTIEGTRVWKSDFDLYTRGVARAPNNPRPHFDLGVTLGEQGRLEEALAEFRRATEIDSNYAPAWSAMGRTEDRLGQHALGLEHCERAVALAPDDALFANDLGMMQFRERQFAAAAQSFQRVLELRPRHWHARFNLALALYQQSDFAGAIRELDMLPNKDQDFPNAWFFLAESQMRAGDEASARQSAAHFLSVHPQDDAMAAEARKIAAGER